MINTHKAKKSLGQNFLKDNNIIDKIIQQAQILKDDHVIEIGPGLGALTKRILPIIGKLDAIEYDKDVIPILKETCKGLGEVKIYNQDILKFDLSKVLTNQVKKSKIIGNLPYNISSPLIFKLLEYSDYIKDMHFMLQKEVVQRMCSRPGQKSYGRLSIMLQYFCQTEELFLVPPTAFTPEPKVDSQIIRLIPYKEKPFIADNYTLFSEVVKAAFSQRRKTLRNTLKNYIDASKLIDIGINPALRAEQIPIEQFVLLSNEIEKHKS